ncbi:uncharacterized protein LOC124129589 isoform X2 [Haliotis rufescens]|uniref:uncharacterized protein LOC124129589 isoform X2 n=1 Tax=Haliotis rufescens TaxID=6454 RepID=UPI00201F2A82|nr:uncharacterized protein LOC124129589 isoform X2 [Haliotis rufescens]
MAAERRFELFSNDSPFSLQYAAPFAIQGRTFNCVLQYVMYRKADLFKDKQHAIDIMASTDLKQIERYGKSVRNVDTYTWNKERIKVAELALKEKFTQNPDLKEQLLATFPRTLVYATTKDRFWSIGLSEQNPKAWVMKEWKGDNVLGFTLTKIRDKLMENRLEEGGDGQDQRVEGQVSRDSMRQGGWGNSLGVGEQASWDSKRQYGIGNSHVVKAHTSRDSIRQGGIENSHVVEGQVSRDSMRHGTIGNSHRTEGQLSRDSLRQGWIENSHVVEGQVSRDRMRHGTIGNSHRTEGQLSRDSLRQGGIENSHVVQAQVSRDRMRHGTIGNSHRTEGQLSRDSLRQGGIENSHVVEGQVSRDSMRQGGWGNSLGVGEQASWDSKRQYGIGNSHVVKAHTSRDSIRQGGIENSHVVEGQVSRDSMRHGTIGNSHRTEGQLSRDSLRQGGIENSHVVEGQVSRDSMRQGTIGNSHGTEGQVSRDSMRQGTIGNNHGTEEMPQWEETDPTSRPKRKMTQEQTDNNCNKHGRRNMGLRNTKTSYTEMPNQDKFVLFFGNQSPFSQHHLATFTIDGTTFNCAEQYVMYQKTVIFENKEMERKIMETSNPVQQERYGRQIPEFKFEVWNKHFIEVVDRATEVKFSQNPHLLEHLVATHPKLLVEASPSDRLWGIGRGQKDPLAWDKETWRGKNQLGYIITRVRDRLMKVKDTHWEEWEKWKDDKRWEEEEAREKREKRRWESDPYRGRHEERIPKTKRQGDGVHDGSMMLMKEDGMTSQSRRESYKHVSGKENFEFFGGIKSPFSQLYPASFTIDGQTFTSAEHFTLYQMAVIFEDQECQEKIMSTSDPSEQNRYTYDIQNFQWNVWEQKCVQVVERGITAKFTQNSELRGQLFATYPKLLAECKYDDDYWSTGYGLGFAKRKSKAWDTNNWRGENVLGYTLTAVRDRLMEMEKGQKGQTELDVEDVRLQGTIEGDGAHLDRKILVEEKGRTGKEAAVVGENGEIQQDVMTEKEEANVEIRRSDADVEEDESKPHKEQDVRENWDSEKEEFTVGGSELRDNEDADTTLAGDRNVMEQYHRARNSVGEEGNNGSVPLEGEDDGTEEEGVVGLDSTEVAEGNVAEQQKLQKRIGEELKTEEEVTSLAEDESSTKEKNEEEGESTENEEAERLENGCIGEEVTLVKSDVAEDDNVDALNSTNERAMNTEEQLEVAGKTAGEVATIEEDNKVVPETDTLEDVVDRVGEGGRETLDQQEGVGERVNQEEEVTQVPDEETFGGMERDEMEKSEMVGTEKEVLREAISVPEGMERDAEGGRTVMERVEKESNDTGKDVKTEEEVTSPEGTERDCKGGVKARERVEKEGNDAGKEVKRDKEVPFVEGTSVVDVETLAGGERDGDDTKKDPEKVKSEQIDMDVEDSMSSQSRCESYRHVSGKDNFEFFGGIKSPFSQHYPASFTIDGQTFTSAEHFTLYQMAVIFEDQECQEKIMSTSDPSEQDRYTYDIQNFQWNVWEQKCVQVVERGITAKFTQNSELRGQLFATYPKLLAECKYDDDYWSTGYGLGFAKRKSKAWDTNNWRGENVLGYTLTAVRDRLMEMEKGQKGQTELDVEDVRLQGTIEGDGAHLDRKILVEEKGRTGKEAAVVGENGEIQQDVMTEKEEANVEIRRSDADVEEDESKPHKEQDVRENWDSEKEEFTVGGSELRDNEDADTTLAGDRNVMEQYHRARNSVGEEGNNGSVPLEGEDDGTEEEGVVGLDSTEVAEGNVAEQQKLQKRIGEELKKEEEVTSLAEDESSTKEKNEEEGESTENEEAERLENGCIGEEVTLVKSDVAEDDNVDALNSTNERAMNTEEQLEVAGKTAGEVATIEEDNKVVPETDTLEDVVDRVGEGGRETLDQQEGVGERVNQEEEVTQVPDEETFGGMERDEMEKSEMVGTEKEVLREAISVPEGMERDAEGGRTVMERVEKESNDTGKDVKTEEEVTSPEGTERDCKGGVKARERVEKEGNDAGKEVKRDKEVPFVEGTSVVDVETLAGGERDGDDTKKDPEKVKSEQIDMDVEDSMSSQSRCESYRHVSGKDNFEFFGGIKSPFSQHYPASFTIDGQTFTSAEHFTLYQMAVIFEDQECQEKIMSTSDPSEQDRYTYDIQNFQWNVWEQKCVQVVERGITAKFTQNSELRGQLFATYPKLLAECKYDDDYWSTGYGLGFAKRKSKAWDTNNWRGENVLGYTLTAVRDRLMEMEKGQKGQTELDVEDVRLQGTIEGDGAHLDRKILVEEKGRTGKEAAVVGENGEIQQDVMTEKEEANVEIRRSDADVEEDESKPHKEQDVRENWDSEKEEFTVGGSELRDNEDADTTLAGDRNVMEQYHRARNSVGEEGNNGSVPLEGEDDGTEEEGVVGLDSTEVAEGNVAEQQKLQKRIGEELKKEEEVTSLAEDESSTKEKNEEEGESTENEEAERLENGCIGEEVTLVKSDVAEDDNVDALNSTNERAMNTEEQLEVAGKTAGEVATIEEDNKVVPETDTLEDVVDRVGEGGRETLDQQEGVGERVNQEEEVTHVPDEETFGGMERDEMEKSEMVGTEKEVLREAISVPEGMERDAEGGRTVMERVEKESNDTGKDVKTEEEVTSPEGTERDCKGGVKARERVEKEGNDAGKEVKRDKEVPFVEGTSVVDVKTLAGGERDGDDTKKDPEKVKSEQIDMDVEDSMSSQSRCESYRHVSGKDNFEFFGGIKSPFSQHYPASFTIDGQTFTSAEHFTLYQMAVIFEDQECQEKIMSTSDPSEQDRYTYDIQNFQWNVWEQKCVQVVERGITAKFTQNSELRGQLFATYPKLLAECKYDDDYWSTGYGLGFAKRKSKAWDTNNWRGENVLGYTLTAVRDRLMEMEKGQKGQTELDVEDVRLQGTIEGDGAHLDRKILVEEKGRTGKEAAVVGENGEIQQDVMTEKEEANVEIRRSDADVEEDESKPHKEQDVRENWDSEKEEFTVGGSELRDNEDADTTLAGDRNVMEQYHRARNSVGEEGNNGSVPLEGEDDGTEEEGVVGLDSTEVAEGNVAEQQKLQKRIGEELKKEEEVTSLAEDESSTKEKNEEEGESTENEEAERLENGCIGEEVTLVKSDVAEDDNVDALNSTNERAMNTEEQLEVAGKTAGEVATIEEDNKVVPETDTLEDVVDRVGEGGRETLDQQAGVGERVNQEEEVTQVPDEETFGGMERDEMEKSEMLGTEKEVLREAISVPEGMERDAEGGRTVMERVEKESNDTGKDVKTEEEVTSPEGTERDCKGGVKARERVEKEGNDAGKEVKRDKEVPFVEGTSVVDVETLAGGERDGDDTKKDPEKVKSEQIDMDVEDSMSSQSRCESYRHVSGKDNFEFFGGIKSPFSQHYPASFTIDGQTFTSAEHFTLYQMAVIFEDQECQEKIMSTSDPSEQDRYTYDIQNFQWNVWEQKCVQVVERGITAKFTQNSELRGQLFATYPKLLAECKYDDDYWSTGYGLGFAKRKSKAWDTNNWRGENVLGYTLTAVRDRLMEMEKGQKGQTELDVEDVRLQGTIEGDGAHLDRKILVEEKGRTGKEAAVVGENGEIQQDVMTEKEEANVEIRRSDADVEEDESKPHKEQDVRENWDSEKEEFTVGGSELRDNEDADTTLAGDRNVMEQYHRARNSVGEEGNNGSVPLEGEDDGTEEEGVVGLDSTEVAEGNVAEQQKLQKRIGEELKKEEEVTSLAEDESSTKEKNEEEGESTENEEVERLENGCIGEEVTLVKSDVAEDDNVDALNSTNERAMNTEEQLEVAGKTAGEVATIEEDNKVVPETDTLEDVVDRVGEGGRETLDQQEGVGERVNQEEEVTQVPDEETFGGMERDEMEKSEMVGTEKEVLREAISVPEGMERDAEGGRTVMETVEKESNDTGKDVKTEEEVTSPEGTERDCKGGVKARERVEKEGNDAGKEVKRDKEVPFVEGTSVVDVETLAGGERDGDHTKKDPEKVKSEQIDMDEEDVGVEDAGEDMKKLNDAGKEVKNGEDVMLVPEDNVIERQCEGERKDPDREAWADDALDEVKTEKRMPEAKTLFEEERDGEGRSGDEEEVEKVDTGDGEDVKTEEEVHITEDKSVMETDEGGKKDLELVEKGEDEGTGKEPTTVGEEFDARNEGNIRGEYERKATVQQKKMSDSAESADLEEDTGGEQDVMKEGEGRDGMEQEEREKTGDVYTELATVVGTERNPQTDKVEEEIDIIDPRGPNKGLTGEADENVMTEEVKAKVQKR